MRPANPSSQPHAATLPRSGLMPPPVSKTGEGDAYGVPAGEYGVRLDWTHPATLPATMTIIAKPSAGAPATKFSAPVSVGPGNAIFSLGPSAQSEIFTIWAQLAYGTASRRGPTLTVQVFGS